MIVKGNDVQLYDLAKDLKETTNVSEKFPSVTAEMLTAIKQFKARVKEGS